MSFPFMHSSVSPSCSRALVADTRTARPYRVKYSREKNAYNVNLKGKWLYSLFRLHSIKWRNALFRHALKSLNFHPIKFGLVPFEQKTPLLKIIILHIFFKFDHQTQKGREKTI